MKRIAQEFRRIGSSSLARNAGWAFLGKGLSIVFQGVYFVLLARLLGAQQYGIFVGTVAMVSTLSPYSTFGSAPVFLRYVSRDPQNFALYWGNVLVTTAVLGTLLVGLLTWGVPLLAHSYSWTLVLCVAIGECFCLQLTYAAGLVFQTFEKMRVTAALNLLVNCLRSLLAWTMLWRMHHATAGQWAVAALSASSIATVIALILVSREHGKTAFSLSLLRRRIGEGFVFAVSGTTGSVYNDIDKAMLGHYGMNTANGIYSMAYRTVDVATMPVLSIHAAAFPRFFRKGQDGVGSTGAYAWKILKRTMPMGLVLAAALFLIAPVIPRLVGSSFNESVSALRWLCLLPLFRSFHLSAGDALTGAGHQRFRLGSQGAAALFNFGINLFLIPRYGWHGAAWSSLATDGMLAVCNWTIFMAVYRRDKIRRVLQ